jgi:hypothetical protein
MTTSIRASYLRLALTTAAKSDIRYYLMGVCVEPRKEGGAYIVASDGQCLMVIIDEEATCDKEVILSVASGTRSKLPMVGSIGDTGLAKVSLSEFEGKPALRVTNAKGLDSHLQISASTVDGKFPDWRRVIPDLSLLKPGCANGVNAHFVTRMLPALAGPSHRSIGLQPYQAEKDAGVVWHLPAHSNVLFVVMPIKNPEVDPDSWIVRWSKVARVAAKVTPSVKVSA